LACFSAKITLPKEQSFSKFFFSNSYTWKFYTNLLVRDLLPAVSASYYLIKYVDTILHSIYAVSTETPYKKEAVDGEVINDGDLPVFLNLAPIHQQQNQFAIKPVKLH